jgi:hypothetical protein
MTELKRLETRTESAANFVRSFATNNSGTSILTEDNHLYCLIGRETDPQGTDNAGNPFPAGSGAWTVELIPPNATQNLSEYDDFWNRAIAAKRVLPTDIYAVIPRRNWVTATPYIPFSKNNPNYQADAAVVITDLNEVWLCCVAGGGNSTVKPVRTGLLTADTTFVRDGRSGILTTADGYTWRYLYTLTATQASKLTIDWVPVPVGSEQMWTPIGDAQRTQAVEEPHAVVYARHVAIECLLNAGVNGSNQLPAGLSFRQFGLMKNPLNSSGVRATLGIYYQKNTVNGTSTDQLRKKTGQFIHVKNIPPVAKIVGNTEDLTVYMPF